MKAHISLIAATLLFSGNYWIAKNVMPVPLYPLQIAGASVLFSVLNLVIRRENERIAKSDIFRIILSGLFGITLNQILFFTGLNLTVPVDTAIINASNPLIIVVLSSLFFKQSFPWFKLSGIVIGGIGAVGLIVVSFRTVPGYGSLNGNLLILANTISWSIYLIIVKPLLTKYHPFLVMKWLFLTGFILAFPFTYSSALLINFKCLSISDWMSIFYIVVGTTFLAYLFISFGLSRLTASEVSVYSYLQPLLVVIIGISFLGQPISLFQVIAGILVVSGVILVGRR